MPYTNIIESATPQNERERLQVLYNYDILDTEAEEDFDALTRLASYICGTPISKVSLLDEHRTWAKAKTGTTVAEWPRETSFCHYAVQPAESAILEVTDAQSHTIFRNFPQVKNEPHIRFYAGAPLVTPSGYRIGTMCVLGYQPKTLTSVQRDALLTLANQVVTLLEFRRQNKKIVKNSTHLNLYKLLFKSSHEMMCILDIKTGVFLEVNDAFQYIMGYTTGELVGQPIGDFLHPDDLAHLQQTLLTMPHHVPLHMESRFFTQSGNTRWLAWTATALDGKWFATARDITELKQSGSEKIDLKDLLVSVLNNSPTGICALASVRDASGVIIDFKWLMLNKAAEQIMNKPAHELIGQNLADYIPPDNRETFLQVLRDVVQNKVSNSSEQQFELGKQPTWFQIISSPLDDGLVIVFNDISARICIEEKLKAQRTFYENILNQIPSDIAVFDPEHRYMFVNPISIKNEEVRNWIIGKDDFEYCQFRQKDIAIAQKRRKLFKQAVAEKRILAWEDQVTLPDGRSVCYLRQLSPVFDANGKLQFVIGYGMDITALKQVEQELITAKEQAEHSMRAKEMFLSMMSHEIRTPLNAVIGMSHILLQENPRPEQIENLKILQFSGENLLTLINDILDFSKIEAGKISLEEIDFSLNNIITSIRQTFSHRAIEKGIRLKARIDSDLPDVLIGDPVRLNQILMNLVSNAVKFTEAGAVTLDITLENETPEIAEIQFAVTDTGIGIPADKLESVFESFTQANSNTTRKFGGTGLGLTITKRLVEMQEGVIAVESEEGRGTTFTVTLRFKKSKKIVASASKHYLDITENNLGHIKLLLVEDNEVNQIIATKFLQKWGISPDYALNGIQALDKVQKRAYDLVLMDLQMPEMDGYDASRAIRNLGDRYAEIPIIALTASAMLDVRDKVLQFGMNDYVTKPFNPNELYQKIVRYTQSGSLPVSMPEHSTPIIPEPIEGYNFTGMLELAGNDKAFLNELLKSFTGTLQEFLAEYETNLLLNPDLSKLRFAAHKIKSVIKLIEARELTNELENAEKLLHAGISEQQAQESVKKVQLLCQHIIKALAEKQEQIKLN